MLVKLLENSDLFIGLLLWSLIGVAWFSLFVVLLFRTGLLYTARNRDGSLKEKIPLSGILTGSSTLLASLIIILLFDYTVVRSSSPDLGFWALFLLNWALYLVVFLYDTFVIDYFVIGRWRPPFLKIPAAMTVDSMAEHIRTSAIKGPLLISMIALVATSLAKAIFL